MTSTTVTPTRAAAQLTFGRVLTAELAKSISARSTKALLAIMVVGIVCSAVAVLFFLKDIFEKPRPWLDAAQLVSIAPNLLLPAFLILLTTSEWSTRSALTTFTLCPRRGWVIAAKSLVAALYALALWALSTGLAFAVAKAGSASNTNVLWNVEPSKLATDLGINFIALASAYLIGLALMNSPAAITLYYVAPIALTTLQVASSASASIVQWINLSTALAETLGSANPVTSTAWAHLATSLAIWIVLPGAIGIWRTLRREAS